MLFVCIQPLMTQTVSLYSPLRPDLPGPSNFTPVDNLGQSYMEGLSNKVPNDVLLKNNVFKDQTFDHQLGTVVNLYLY